MSSRLRHSFRRCTQRAGAVPAALVALACSSPSGTTNHGTAGSTSAAGTSNSVAGRGGSSGSVAGAGGAGGSAAGAGGSAGSSIVIDAATRARLAELVLPDSPTIVADVTNKFADDPRARALGQRLFFDPSFSGPLLDDANTGLSGTLGTKGETGRVACASCHVPTQGLFVDTRSTRGQLSLASSWTHRRSPSLMDVAQSRLLTWDGRRTTAFSIVFGVIESPIEFNSSRLFVAQQLAKNYRADYEALFGPMPALDGFAALDASSAGCTTLPADPLHDQCLQPGHDDENVTRVVANFGKALSAYTRQLTCGRSRFDDWMGGNANALTPDEVAGAALFVNQGKCTGCHSGPYLSDHGFHNVGMGGGLVPFTGIDTGNDPGAAVGLANVATDWLNPKGPFSDGDDGRLDSIPTDLTALQGAFRTPGLRCIGKHLSFMHNAEFRSLKDVVHLFNIGGAPGGFVGKSELSPLGLTATEEDQLVAFLHALEGPGPDASLRTPPATSSP